MAGLSDWADIVAYSQERGKEREQENESQRDSFVFCPVSRTPCCRSPAADRTGDVLHLDTHALRLLRLRQTGNTESSSSERHSSIQHEATGWDTARRDSMGAVCASDCQTPPPPHPPTHTHTPPPPPLSPATSAAFQCCLLRHTIDWLRDRSASKQSHLSLKDLNL